MPKINILYHHFPHYRRAVLKALQSSKKHQYRFFGGLRDVAGIKVFSGDDDVKVHPITFRAEKGASRLSIADYEKVYQDCDAIILIGNPNILATWSIALQARRKGIKVLFWAHGWLKPEGLFKSCIRNIYFRLPDRVLVYGDRAVELAALSGFPRERIRVIYNSLDFPKQNRVFGKYQKKTLKELRQELGLDSSRPVLLALSRLTDICHYELFVEAVAYNPLCKKRPQLIFIGDGPSRQSLEKLAAGLGVDAAFLGAVYDEEMLGRFIMASDAIVSPGKVGLTAMHALAFGTPVITHGNLNAQMPEVEAIEPGKSGEYFNYGDPEALMSAIIRILDSKQEIYKRRNACREIILRKYNPVIQAQLIDEAVNELF